jgi:hypothetical protein
MIRNIGPYNEDEMTPEEKELYLIDSEKDVQSKKEQSKKDKKE